MPTAPFTLGADDERRLVGPAVQRVWELLKRADRSAAEDDDMLHTAQAEAHDLGPFDVGCGHKALARAYRVAGDPVASGRHLADGRALADMLTDPKDREILTGDFDTV